MRTLRAPELLFSGPKYFRLPLFWSVVPKGTVKRMIQNKKELTLFLEFLSIFTTVAFPMFVEGSV